VSDLFSHRREQTLRQIAPLADRMRPRSLDDFVGQEAILGPGRLLRRAITADRVGNLILHGPPGTGKTTLARIIAGSTRAHFSSLNAVLAGVKDLRAAFDAVGALRKPRIICYCGGGISATMDALALTLIGHGNVAVYDGSMSEWVLDAALPMELGA
jgi:rhodanese-related sulfurtransferase